MNPQPIGLTNDLAPLQVMRCTVGQHDIAVWRSASGVPGAWENRCPHRGMRLSYGFVRGESLACAYHGWHYNRSGQCHFIPAHPELTPPQSIRPTLFSIWEHAGLLWVDTTRKTQSSGEDERDEPAESSPEMPNDLHPLRTLSIDCEPEVFSRALSDIAAPGHTGERAGDRASIKASEKAVVKNIPEQAGIMSVDALGNANGFYLVLHAAPAQPMLVHVLVKACLDIEDRIVVSRWCESLRRQAESL